MTYKKRIYKLICLGLLMLLLFCKTSTAQTTEFIIGTETNVTTATVTIPVTANKFNQILAWQGSINWNNSKLNYVSTNAVVSQLNGIQFNASTNGNLGFLSFFWLDNNLIPQSVADSTILFSITFSVVANAAGNTDISFSNSPTALQLADLNGNQISNVNYIGGGVSFANEILPPVFTIGSIANVSTSTITVAVTTKNFIQLLAFQGSIVWDNTRLTFANTSSVSSKLNGIQFNNGTSGNMGQLSFLWIDANLLSQTIADSAILFNITFNVIGSTTGITNVNFSNSPTLLQTSDALGTPITNTVYNNGMISFPGAVLPPIFIMPTISKIETSNFSVPITTKNFTQLKAIQGSISWDNRKYNYINATSSPSQLNGILFNASVSGDIGTLTYVWADANSATQTISDNSVLFTITLNRVCSAIGNNDISFSNTPTVQLVVNAGDTAVTNVTYFNGILAIPSTVSPAIYISTPSNILCNGASPVVSTILSNGGTNPSFQWYKNNVLINGASSPTYTSNSLNNNDTIKCIISSNVACALTNTATSNLIGFSQRPATKDTLTISGCNSVLYNNTTYSSNATKQDTVKTVYGCDSIYRLVQIFIVPLTPINQSINLSGCNNVSYNNISYTSSTTLSDTIKTSQGCDSIYVAVDIKIDKTISGKINHITKSSTIQNVSAFLNSATTGSIVTTGSYQFNCIPTGSNGKIKLSKNNDINKSNGLNSVDVLLVQRHILNTTKLNSAYKIIAADVDGNKVVNSVDVLRMKRLILGTDTTFASSLRGNRLWEFIDSAYTFPDTTNPFPFKDSISFNNLTSNKTNQTFIGVKLGDVNYDWNSNIARGINGRDLELQYSINYKQMTFSNDIIKIPITVNNFKDIAAMQYTLQFDNSKYEFEDIENNVLNIDFNAKQANKNGNITMLWTDSKAEAISLNDGTSIFNLILKPKQGINSTELGIDNLINDIKLELTNSVTNVEAWDNDFVKHHILLSNKTNNLQEILDKNINISITPNPTNGLIKLSVNSNKNQYTNIEVFSSKGDLIYKLPFELRDGTNNLSFNLKDKININAGIYFLKVNYAKNCLIKKIIVN
ncbi:MAG: T9SS type A sorting domain-containing protein [Chitinophagaceae bacterium]